jgi:peptidoglycan/xylan/chitin deacetylase (PgdA/CDA1 family)
MKFLVVEKRRILKGMIVAVIAAVCLLAVGLSDSAKVFSNQSTRRMPIHCVETSAKSVALTFDASFGEGSAASILEVLERHDVRANFFVTGAWAELYSDDLKALANSGRVEIGTHSNTHPHMTKLGQKQMLLELATSVSIIEGASGVKPELFRAPYGEYNDTLLKATDKEQLIPIQWSIDTLDWQDASAYDIASRTLNEVKPGSIVLMHNDGKHTLAALPAVIEGLKNKGYTFQTVGELIYRDNYSIDQSGMQIKRG